MKISGDTLNGFTPKQTETSLQQCRIPMSLLLQQNSQIGKGKGEEKSPMNLDCITLSQYSNLCHVCVCVWGGDQVNSSFSFWK